MKFIKSDNARSYILDNLDQEEILSKFLNIPKSHISNCIKDRNERISNPLRVDKNPSMGFRYYSTKAGVKLLIRDFANSYYSGDIFDIVGIVEGKNPYNPKEFIQIVNSILRSVSDNSKYYSNTVQQIESFKEDRLITFEIDPRPFNKNDFIYWYKHGITPELIKRFNIIAVNKYWKNNYLDRYNYNENDPCYCYYLETENGVDIVKLYFPTRTKIQKRFDTNCRTYIEAKQELKLAENLIITKSRKDKILITRIAEELELDLCITNASSERIINKENANILKGIYKNVFSVFDVDEAGMVAMREMYKLHGILHPSFPPVVIHKLKDNKDISDYCFNEGYNKTKELFKTIYNNLIHLANAS